MRFSLKALALVILLGLGCGGGEGEGSPTLVKDVPSVVPSIRVPGPDETKRRPPPPPAKPACEAKLGPKGVVMVAGKPTGLVFKAKSKITVYPLDAKQILVTTRYPWIASQSLPATGSIWAVTCAAPHAHQLFLEKKGADFGTAALSVDRRTLFYTTISGVRALNLQGKDDRTVTQPGPAPDTCWSVGGKKRPRLIDIVQGVRPDSGSLIVARGAFCGLQGVWVSEVHWVSDPAAPRPGQEIQPRPVTTVAKDARGNIYVGDGGHCDQPGVQVRQSHGYVFKSTDRGVSWRAISVRVDRSRMHTGARTLLADKRRGGHLVVLSSLCRTPFGSYGGLLYMTRDGGRTWRKIPVSGEVGETVDGGVGVDAVALAGGSIDRLYVWNKRGDRYRSLNTGKSWELSPTTRGLPKPLTEVTVPGATLSLNPDGLSRKATGGVNQLLHPQTQAMKGVKRR